MKLQHKIAMTCMAVALIATDSAFAQTHHKAPAGPLTCPVTHLTIPSATAAVGTSHYKGKTYYFCTANCKKLFDKSPAKYAH